jgi:hypothetical protein
MIPRTDQWIPEMTIRWTADGESQFHSFNGPPQASFDAALVLEKKMSAHAAMIKAGFIRVPTVVEQIEKLWAKLSASEKKRLLRKWVKEN